MKQLLLFFLKCYKRFISPLLGANCRYYPSCSNYMMNAIENCGVIKGIALGIWRILRCNPWSDGGVDHAPKCGCEDLQQQ